MIDLSSFHPNVPTEMPPLWWSLDRSLETNLARVESWRKHFTRYLPLGNAIDEVAIQTMNFDRVRDYLRQDDDWKLFNTAEDVVYANPFGTRYTVSYRFYRHPALPYRLEVMVLGNQTGEVGFSPVHHALWNQTVRMRQDNDGLLPIPHFSYKPQFPKSPVTGKEMGPRRAYGQTVNHLRKEGFIPVQACQSTYGVFGYFIQNETDRQVYLKPRVNLRDAGHDCLTGGCNDQGEHGTCTHCGEQSGHDPVAKKKAECGQPYPCEHAPNGGNHPVVKA